MLILSGITDDIDGFVVSCELVAREGIAIIVTITAIVKTDAATAKNFFMTFNFNGG